MDEKNICNLLHKGSFMDLIDAVGRMDNSSGVPQDIYVMEECSELIKELTKKQRGKGDQEKIFDEACDVLVTVFVMLRCSGVSGDDVRSRIMYKCRRALARHAENGEV